MQNIKPLQTNKPKIMSNREAIEELERYNPKEEIKENLESKLDNNFENHDFYKEAVELYNNILRNMWSEGENLCRRGIEGSDISTYDNALMVMLYKLLGRDEEAEMLYNKINKTIKKRGLYNDSVFLIPHLIYEIHKDKFTHNNAAMAIACLLLGKSDEAEKIYEEINKKIGKSNKYLFYYRKKAGMFHTKNKVEFFYTKDNALMGILCCLLNKKSEAEEICNEILSSTKDTAGLCGYEIEWHNEGSLFKRKILEYVSTDDNALTAMLCKLLGKNKEAEELFNNIKSNIKKVSVKGDELYIAGPTNLFVSTASNASMAILDCLLSGMEFPKINVNNQVNLKKGKEEKYESRGFPRPH